MPVYNSELYIKEAIDSILNQTFSDFELIIIDDASTDKSVEIIQSYTDSRIQLILKPKNSGYTNSLNYGLTIAKGEYIARMDSDDISLPTRFEKQVTYLDANSEYILCGSQYQIIGTNKITKNPCLHEEIKVRLISECCIAHPSVMFRLNKMKEFGLKYNNEREPAEDYDLWLKLVFIGKIANLNEVLLHYRIHENQVSNTRNLKQRKISNTLKFEMLHKLDESLKRDCILFQDILESKIEDIKNAYNVLLNLEKYNSEKLIFNVKFFKVFIFNEKLQICKLVKNKNNLKLKSLIKLFVTSPKVYYYMMLYYCKKWKKKN